jgi:hypothetical protein
MIIERMGTREGGATRAARGGAGAVLALAAALLAGCGPSVVVREEAFRRAAPATVAVLPFVAEDEDVSDARAALEVEVLREVVGRRFGTLAYLHLEEDAIDALLARAGLADARAVAETPAVRLGEILGVDAVLRGVVTDLADIQAGILARRVIGAELRLVDARSGEELVTLRHEQSRTVGVLTGNSSFVDAIQEPLETGSDLGFLRLAEKFAEQACAAFPPPPRKVVLAPPEIRSATVTAGLGRTLRAGDRIAVLVRGAPGLAGSFDAGPAAREVPLHEEAPGLYRGAYRVAIGDAGEGAVEVHLEDRFGAPATRILRDARVAIDARPAPVGALALERAEGGGWRLASTPAAATARPSAPPALVTGAEVPSATAATTPRREAPR